MSESRLEQRQRIATLLLIGIFIAELITLIVFLHWLGAAIVGGAMLCFVVLCQLFK